MQATALRSAANGVVITDRSGHIIWVNPAACRNTGYSPAELIGQHTRMLKSGEHAPEFYAGLWQTLLRGDTWSGTIVNRRKDGTLYDEEQTIAPVIEENGVITHFVAIKQDVTQQHELQEALARANRELAAQVAEIESLNRQLREQVGRDPLTGLHNRRYFEERAPLELARATAARQTFTLVILDIDHFKSLNDTFGHAAGDRALQTFSTMLWAHTRRSDLVCRVGGEEFLVAMSNCSLDDAVRRAETWRTQFAACELNRPGDPLLHRTVSIGVAEHRPGEESLEETIARCDAALYEAKQSGRNRVVVAR